MQRPDELELSDAEIVERGRAEREARMYARRERDIAEWRAQDRRASLTEYLFLRDKAKREGAAALTDADLRRCRQYVARHTRMVDDARRARRIYSTLPKRQQRQFRTWTPSEFLADRQAPRPRTLCVRRRARRVRTHRARPRAPASQPSDDDDHDVDRSGDLRVAGFTHISELVAVELRRLRGAS